jgi:hypothetical protein
LNYIAFGIKNILIAVIALMARAAIAAATVGAGMAKAARIVVMVNNWS